MKISPFVIGVLAVLEVGALVLAFWGGSMMGGVHGTQMGSAMEDMTVSLQGKTGDAFDEAFLDEMTVHHEGAVAMARQVLATSKRPELLKLANDIIAAQTGEITMMQGWKQAWFGR